MKKNGSCAPRSIHHGTVTTSSCAVASATRPEPGGRANRSRRRASRPVLRRRWALSAYACCGNPCRRRTGSPACDEEALDQLAMIDVAQRAGFTLREVRLLLDGLHADVPPADEWRELARENLGEIEQLLVRTEAMRTLLQTSLECDCLTLKDIDDFRHANAEWAREQLSP